MNNSCAPNCQQFHEELPNLTRDEECQHIRTYALNARPLGGCCTCDSEEYERGRAAIIRLAAGEFESLSAEQCANVLRFILIAKLPTEDAADAGLRNVLGLVEEALREEAAAAA